MSLGDYSSVAATLFVGGLVYFIGGRDASLVAMLIACLIVLYVRRRGAQRLEPPNTDEAIGKELTEAFDSLQSPPPAPEIDEDIPDLRLVEEKRTFIGEGNSVWYADDSLASNGIVLIFVNQTKPIGRRTPFASKVAAHLTFRNESGQATHVNYGTWSGEFTRFMKFAPGDKKRLIISFEKNGTTYSLENPNSTNPFKARRFPHNLTIYTARETPIIEGWNQVDVELVDDDVTVYRETFSYKRDERGNMRFAAAKA